MVAAAIHEEIARFRNAFLENLAGGVFTVIK